MNGVLEEMTKSNDYKGAKFVNLPAEDLSEISQKYNISAVPTVLLMRNGKVVDRVDGAYPGQVGEKVKEILRSGGSLPSEPIHYHPSVISEDDDIHMPESSLEDRLKKLINKAPCMLFMKGDPSNPRCGFSRTIIALLDEHNIDYRTFDILHDNAVREGLKVYSKWPTYPQLYFKGELLGGLDIVKEMIENNELDMLPKKVNETK